MKSGQKIDLGLTGYDELFMTDQERAENKLPRIYDIPLSEIDPFPDHPFQVRMDEDMSDNLEAMKAFRDFLAAHHITNVASDSYTLDWNTKTITITAYADTKAQSRLINEYIENSPLKFKRLVQATTPGKE